MNSLVTLSLAFLLVGYCSTKPLNNFEEYMSAQKDYRDRETLSFGDKCLWTDEEIRLKAMEKIHSIFQNLKSEEDFKTLASEFKTINLPTQAFCKEDDNLQCIQTTGKCGCEETKKYQPYMNSTAIEKDSKCFYAEGSSCMDSDYRKQSVCEPGTECRIVSSNGPCTDSNIFAGILEKNKGNKTNDLEIFKAGTMASFSGFCKCIKT